MIAEVSGVPAWKPTPSGPPRLRARELYLARKTPTRRSTSSGGTLKYSRSPVHILGPPYPALLRDDRKG
eukprot:322214-Pyramimonas_sp.AAC.1